LRIPRLLFGVISRDAHGRDDRRARRGDRDRRSGIPVGHPKVLELGAVVAVASFTVVALIADPSVTSWLERFARAISAGLLALIAFESLALTPFTEQYARESVPQQFWSSPRFKQVNRDLTLMWALVFLAMVPSHIVAGIIDTRRANTIFNWVIPIALVVYAVKRTGRVTCAEDGPPERPRLRADSRFSFRTGWPRGMTLFDRVRRG
jgi:hypothetical protein